MINPITVSDEVTKMESPKANVNIGLANDDLIVSGDFVVGPNIIAVNFKEHPEVGLGNDIHLIKVNENTKIEDVSLWMDWLEIGGLTSHALAIFIGGTQEMPVGYTSYIMCDLEAGDYALVAETPLGRFKTFSVK